MQPSATHPIRMTTSAEVAIKLADEGVPVCAIARAVTVPLADVYELLKEAKEAGRLIELPPNDWPAGGRDNRTRAERDVLTMEDGALQIALSSIFRFTRLQSLVLLTLLRRAQATKEQLHNAIENHRVDAQDPTDQKMVDVVICHIRARMKKWAVANGLPVPEIKTIWGIGYSVAPNDRQQIVSYIQAFLANPVKVL